MRCCRRCRRRETAECRRTRLLQERAHGTALRQNRLHCWLLVCGFGRSRQRFTTQFNLVCGVGDVRPENIVARRRASVLECKTIRRSRTLKLPRSHWIIFFSCGEKWVRLDFCSLFMSRAHSRVSERTTISGREIACTELHQR